MKRILAGILVFFSAFVVGYITVLLSLTILFRNNETGLQDPEPPLVANAVSATLENSATATKPNDQLETIEEVNGIWTDTPSNNSTRLLEVGEGMPSDASPRNGETWLGLFEMNGDYFLRRTKLIVSRHFETVPGENQPVLSRMGINVPGDNKPILLLKGGQAPREGKVETAFRGMDDTVMERLEKSRIDIPSPYTFLDKDFRKTFEIRKKTYVLKVEEAKNEAGEKIWALLLYAGSTRQTLYTVPADYVQMGLLYWVGDLDHDGRPDIYCSLYDSEEEGGGSVLFLSSSAEEGKLVRKVAQFAWADDC